MKKQTTLLTLAGATLAFSAFFVSTPVYAAECAGTSTAIIECEDTGADGIEGTGLWGLLLLAINILTGGVGVAAIGGIVYASILYTSAGGNQEQVKKARGIITNVVIGVVAFALMYALLNFIIPGGVFA
ncbi:hypothetical protein GW930_03540 [Candidatus Saccharibacteria bacterium]|nr:hypothetical protein [Candidatus Saccharibacteria bacterium]